MPASAAAPTVPRSNLFTSLPGIGNATQVPASTFSNQSGGRVGVLTLELPDAYDAVQIGVINPFATRWGLAGMVVAPSANYGGDPVIGAAPYDRDGAPLHEMLPVQWGNGGANSQPPGNQVISLPTLARAPGGQTMLTFPTTAASTAYGGVRPAVGWFVADGLGCIPSDARVAAVTATTVSLSAPVAAQGCGGGQAIYFAPQALASFSHAVAPGSGDGNIGLTFSDWIPLHSLPRTDGGFAVGGVVSGSAVAPGTTLSAIDFAALTLSHPLTAALPAQSPLDIHYARSLAQPASAGSTSLSLSNSSSVLIGQTVTAGSALPSRTHVIGIQGSTVTLDKPIATGIAAGATVNFTNRVWTSLPAPAGATSVSVPSTSGLPLLHIRFTNQSGPPITVTQPMCKRKTKLDVVPCEAPLGLPPVWAAAGGQSSGHRPIDGINYVSRLGAGNGALIDVPAYPSFFIRLLGRDGGGTLLQCGGYQVSGAVGSVSGEASAGRIAAAVATRANPAVPIAAVGVASRQNDTATNFANCTALIDAIAPTMVLIQDFSDHNKSDIVGYRAQVQTVATHALDLGIQPIIFLAYGESAAVVGGLTVASDVRNSTFVPLQQGINGNVAGSPTLITGPGIAAGTTATVVPGTWYLTLSQPATIAAGSVLFLGFQVDSSNGTRVVLTQPSFENLPNGLLQAPGVPADTNVTLSINSTVAKLSAAASLAHGTMLTVKPNRLASIARYGTAAQWFLTATDPWATTYIDAYDAIGTDPNNSHLICPGCSTQGAYVNDRGQMIIANLLVPLLRTITGQGGGQAAAR